MASTPQVVELDNQDTPKAAGRTVTCAYLAEKYGAKGTGVEDDTEALQRAVNDGCIVQGLPDKNYLITRPIDCPANSLCLLYNVSLVINHAPDVVDKPIFDWRGRSNDNLFMLNCRITSKSPRGAVVLAGDMVKQGDSPRTCYIDHIQRSNVDFRLNEQENTFEFYTVV